MVLLRKIVFYVFLFFPAFAQSQLNRDAYEAMKDTLVSDFNQGDYEAIYRLFDTSFSNKISQLQLVNFFKGNQNSGKIVASSFLTEDKDKLSYLSLCQTEITTYDAIANVIHGTLRQRKIVSYENC